MQFDLFFLWGVGQFHSAEEVAKQYLQAGTAIYLYEPAILLKTPRLLIYF